MAEKKKRGRPKGSGIDDQRRLRDIARLMAAEPGLKPTTAIRSLGYGNPSIIRRLRDKLNADFERLISEARRDIGIEPKRPSTSETPAISRMPVRSPESHRQAGLELSHQPRSTTQSQSLATAPNSRVAVLKARREPTGDNTPEPRPTSHTCLPKKQLSTPPAATAAEATPATRHDEATLVEIGFRAAAAAMRQHLNICAQVSHIPAVAAFIRQQMFLTEIMLGVGVPSFRPPSSRH